METTVGIVTALNPVIGYEKARSWRTKHTRAEKESWRSSASADLTEAQIADLLIPPSSQSDKNAYRKK
jgi:fumarate hydratase class II